MANPRRGEIEAIFDGQAYTLCLTLGALAELEHAFGASDLLALAERFEKGRIAASDALKIIASGLKGGGHTLTQDEVAELRTEGGAVGYIRIVAELLNATFGAEQSDQRTQSASAARGTSPRPRLAREDACHPPAPPLPGAR